MSEEHFVNRPGWSTADPKPISAEEEAYVTSHRSADLVTLQPLSSRGPHRLVRFANESTLFAKDQRFAFLAQLRAARSDLPDACAVLLLGAEQRVCARNMLKLLRPWLKIDIVRVGAVGALSSGCGPELVITYRFRLDDSACFVAVLLWAQRGARATSTIQPPIPLSKLHRSLRVSAQNPA